VNTTEYLTGARPVVGTVGACGLMLLACSWFVLGPGDLGRSRDVGSPAPVHVGDVTGEPSAGGAPHKTATPTRARRIPLARAQHVSPRRDVAANATIAPAGHEPSPAAAATQSPSTAPAAPSRAATPTTPGVPATQPAPELPAVTPTLPAPLDGLPQATLPSVQLPAVQLPDVSSTTTKLGLP
jgi:hypothetical protein